MIRASFRGCEERREGRFVQEVKGHLGSWYSTCVRVPRVTAGNYFALEINEIRSRKKDWTTGSGPSGGKVTRSRVYKTQTEGNQVKVK